MIVIQGTIPIRADGREAAVAAAREMREATLGEEGCLEYRFGFAMDDPDVVIVIERWASDEALAAHAASPHMARFGEAVAGVVAGPADVSRYETDGPRPLFG